MRLTTLITIALLTICAYLTGQDYSQIRLYQYTNGAQAKVRVLPTTPEAYYFAVSSEICIDRAIVAATWSGDTSLVTFEPYMVLSPGQLLTTALSGVSAEDITIGQDLQADLIDLFESQAISSSLEDIIGKKRTIDDVFSFQTLLLLKDFSLSQALQFAFEDNLQPNTNHIYRIRLCSSNDNWSDFGRDALDTQYAPDISVVEGDSIISFSWSSRFGVLDHKIWRQAATETIPTCIEPSMALNITPLYSTGSDQLNYADRMVTNYVGYNYMVYGHTMFDDSVLLAEFSAMSRDLTAPNAPRLSTVELIDSATAQISWSFDSFYEEGVQFIIGRSQNWGGPYARIHDGFIPSDYRVFNDTYFASDTTNYYSIQAYDTSGNFSYSMPHRLMILDTLPPSGVNIDSISIDSVGAVTIHVPKTKEKDLNRFLLLRSNSLTHEFSVIQDTLVDSIQQSAGMFYLFDTISLNSLTQQVYYTVIARDRNFNMSQGNDTVFVTRPDTIPPGVPMVKGYEIYPDSIVLDIAFGPGTMSARILRNASQSSELDTVLVTVKSRMRYTDPGISPGASYTYSVIASDAYGNKSSTPGEFIITALPEANMDTVITAVRSYRNNRSVVISWEYSSNPDNTGFEIYMSIEGEDTHYVGATDAGQPMVYVLEDSEFESFEFAKFLVLPVSAQGQELVSDYISPTEQSGRLRNDPDYIIWSSLN